MKYCVPSARDSLQSCPPPLHGCHWCRISQSGSRRLSCRDQRCSSAPCGSGGEACSLKSGKGCDAGIRRKNRWKGERMRLQHGLTSLDSCGHLCMYKYKRTRSWGVLTVCPGCSCTLETRSWSLLVDVALCSQPAWLHSDLHSADSSRSQPTLGGPLSHHPVAYTDI